MLGVRILIILFSLAPFIILTQNNKDKHTLSIQIGGGPTGNNSVRFLDGVMYTYSTSELKYSMGLYSSVQYRRKVSNSFSLVGGFSYKNMGYREENIFFLDSTVDLVHYRYQFLTSHLGSSYHWKNFFVGFHLTGGYWFHYSEKRNDDLVHNQPSHNNTSSSAGSIDFWYLGFQLQSGFTLPIDDHWNFQAGFHSHIYSPSRWILFKRPFEFGFHQIGLMVGLERIF